MSVVAKVASGGVDVREEGFANTSNATKNMAIVKNSFFIMSSDFFVLISRCVHEVVCLYVSLTEMKVERFQSSEKFFHSIEKVLLCIGISKS